MFGFQKSKQYKAVTFLSHNWQVQCAETLRLLPCWHAGRVIFPSPYFTSKATNSDLFHEEVYSSSLQVSMIPKTDNPQIFIWNSDLFLKCHDVIRLFFNHTVFPNFKLCHVSFLCALLQLLQWTQRSARFSCQSADSQSLRFFCTSITKVHCIEFWEIMRFSRAPIIIWCIRRITLLFVMAFKLQFLLFAIRQWDEFREQHSRTQLWEGTRTLTSHLWASGEQASMIRQGRWVHKSKH